MNNSRHSILFLALSLLFFFIQGCNNTSSRNSDYAPFPVDGWGVKYFNINGKPIESKKWAYYFRKAYYRNGKPDSDSLATDYYMSGEKKSEGYLISENPDVYNGFRNDYYVSGAFTSQFYDNGVPSGVWCFYLKDGTLFSVTRYKNGIEESFTQYENGYKYRDGIYKEGVFYQDIYYYTSGKIEHISTYNDSNRDSYVSEGYYESGKVKYRANFAKAPDFATSHKYKTVGNVYKYDERGYLTITNNDPKPIIPKTKITKTTSQSQRISNWDRGYSYGWNTGFQDGVDGNEKWCSYNDSGKGGEFLDGYTSGYEDGYTDGRREWRENNDSEDDEDY